MTNDGVDVDATVGGSKNPRRGHQEIEDRPLWLKPKVHQTVLTLAGGDKVSPQYEAPPFKIPSHHCLLAVINKNQ